MAVLVCTEKHCDEICQPMKSGPNLIVVEFGRMLWLRLLLLVTISLAATNLTLNYGSLPTCAVGSPNVRFAKCC